MARARLKYVRMSPHKVSLVLDRIRGKKVVEAYRILKLVNRRAAQPVKKVLDSAVANAGAPDLRESAVVKKAWAGPGPSIKRLRPRAMGRANIYKRRTAHIEIEVQ